MADSREVNIFAALLRNAAKVMDIDLFCVALFNKVTVALDFWVAKKESGSLGKLEPGEGRWASRPYEPGRFLPDHVLAGRSPLLIETNVKAWIDKHEVAYPANEFPHSWLGVPIVTRDDVIGIAVVENYEREYAYDERSSIILSTMADRVASAITNNRMVENLRVVNQVGQKLASGIDLSVDNVLTLVHEQASQLMNTHNMYVALYDAEKQILGFPLAMYDGSRETDWPSRKVEIEDETKGGLTEQVIRTRNPFRPANVADWYEEKNIKPAVLPVPKSWLGVPMMIEDRVLGVIALQNDDFENLYGQGDQEVLRSMANQAAVAIDNARLRDYLVAKNRQLETLVQVGQELNSGIRLQQKDILDSVYQQAGQLVDIHGMYVALYDAGTQILSFPLAEEYGEGEEIPERRVEIDDEEKGGLTEIVIRTKEPLCIGDVTAWLQEKNRELPIPPIPKSWMGVPIKLEDKVLGVISLRNEELENLYGQDDVDVLQTIADQAAVAIENARLFKEARAAAIENARLFEEARELEDQVIANKQLATLGTAMAALQHRINNTFNIIVPNVTRLRNRVDETDETIAEILDMIERNARYTSDIIKRIQEPLQKSEMQKVDINAVIGVVVGVATRETKVAVTLDLDDSIPLMQAPIGQISEIFRNLADNACHAMKGVGQLVVTSCLDGDIVSVRVQDTGPGITPQVQERLFVKPVPSREPGGGAGLGLWLSQLMLQTIGGDVTIGESDSDGTTMLVEIPVPVAGEGGEVRP